MMGGISPHFLRTARRPGIPGLAKSLRAWRPSGQPVWRPALHFLRTARRPGIPGLAESLRAWRPSGQPVWRPALHFSPTARRLGIPGLAKSLRAWRPSGQPVWRPALRTAGLKTALRTLATSEKSGSGEFVVAAVSRAQAGLCGLSTMQPKVKFAGEQRQVDRRCARRCTQIYLL